MRRFLQLVALPLLFLFVALATTAMLSFLGDRAFGEWRLVFLGWDRAARLIPLIIFCLLSVGCIALLFGYEQKLVSPRLGFTLLTLRLLLILTLFLTLLEPVWSWSYDEEEQGRVLVALDLSESMDTQDQYATEAEKLRWAKALGMIGADDSAERIDRWIAAYEKGQEPEWVAADETADAAKRQQLTQARQANVQGLLKQLDGLTRKDILQRLILAEPNPFAKRFAGIAQVEFCTFAGDVSTVPEADLTKLLEQPDPTLLRGRTDMTQPLAASATESAETPLVGIVLFSDGRDNVHPTPQQFTSRLAGSLVPMHTVLVGSERRPRDLAIISVEHPEKVFQDDDPIVRATVRTSGFSGQPLKVQLEGAEGEQFEALVENIVPNGDVAEVSFKLDDLAEGRHRFRISTEVRPDETRDDNNEREFAVEVVDDKAEVLLVEGEGRWEFRYLDAALQRDERVELSTVLFDQPYMGVLPETFFPRELGDLATPANDGTSRLSEFDAVIVGDVQMTHLNRQVWEQLDRFVREEGGTLILLSGKNYFPQGNTYDLVKDLLPVEKLRVKHLIDEQQFAPPDRRGFRLELTPDGQLQPMFQFDVDPVKNEQIWSALPGHTWGLVGEAKRNATVWATSPPEGGQDLGLEGERRRAVIAQHYVGTGQVVWIGIDSTWRWRFRAGDQYHHRFWGQLVRWAVDFKATAGNNFVRFGVGRPVVSTGEPIVFRAQWDERFLKQNAGLKANAVITRRNSEEAPITIPLTALDGRAFVYEGRQVATKPGDYVVRLEVPGMPFPDVIEVEFNVSDQLSPELQDVSANRELLEQAAQLTGGRFFLPDQLDQLPELFQDSTSEKSIQEEVTVYDHWLILVIFCAFAMSEWILRKINGLP